MKITSKLFNYKPWRLSNQTKSPRLKKQIKCWSNENFTYTLVKNSTIEDKTCKPKKNDFNLQLTFGQCFGNQGPRAWWIAMKCRLRLIFDYGLCNQSAWRNPRDDMASKKDFDQVSVKRFGSHRTLGLTWCKDFEVEETFAKLSAEVRQPKLIWLV